MTKKKTRKAARDAETGQFTTIEDAKNRPKETVVETTTQTLT
ncbi:hypothetical protein [Vibrio fluvialis]|nr:hypothetical protein [Vibrio fluvialis]BEI23099.1 hypothetical protein KKIDH5335_14310 [Vibrio fluvialis]